MQLSDNLVAACTSLWSKQCVHCELDDFVLD